MQPVFHGSVPCFPSAATLQSVFQRASLCLWCFFRLLRITGRLPKLSPSCAVRSWEVLFFSRLSHPNSSGITSGRRAFPLLKCRASLLIEEIEAFRKKNFLFGKTLSDDGSRHCCVSITYRHIVLLLPIPPIPFPQQ